METTSPSWVVWSAFCSVCWQALKSRAMLLAKMSFFMIYS
ncbi:hypothetical protein AO381_1267 [Moraxella catarrhalis]|nr:hypothetical protein AO381_1267 [Moraxella catarrhalis]